MCRWWINVLLMAFLVMFPFSIYAEIDTARQNELIYLLKQDCGSCHGMTLKGGLGPALLPQSLQDKPDALLVDTVLLGRAGTAMPPWSNQLTREDVEWLIEQLRAGISDED